jgi:hypothetical protein
MRAVGQFAHANIFLIFVAISPAHATPVSSCDPVLPTCYAYEGSSLALPTTVIAGDVIVQSSGITYDVFRIFNDVLNTGNGTGLGMDALLYGDDQGNLPDPSTYSSNAITVALGSSGPPGYLETDYLGSTDITFELFTPIPEPDNLCLPVFAALTLLLWRSLRRPTTRLR